MSDHEAIVKVKIGSERSFGLIIGAVLAIIALWPLLGGGGIRIVWGAAAALFVAAGLFIPKLLYWPNRWWFRFGMLLGAIVAPIVMLLVYITTFVPFGLALRAMRKDLLSLERDPQASTYWIERKQPPQQMSRQF